jgi:hypothetical protein
MLKTLARIFGAGSLCLLLIAGEGLARQAAPQDTVRGLPTLEIPEITIIGKKAITLPFARKGEIFDVSVAGVPAPDSSLLESRPAINLPIGALPRYDEPLVPLHLSAEGTVGNFGTFGGRAFVKYVSGLWGFDGDAGYSTTQGHVDNSASNAFRLNGRARSIVATDNDLLKSFRLSLGTRFIHDSYGMFGIRDSSPDRSRNNFALDIALRSLDHRTNDIGIAFSADISSVSDSYAGYDSSVSVVSPSLGVTYETDLGGSLRLMSELRYASSALNYDHSVQSPSCASFDAGMQWKVAEGWYLEAGGTFASATGSSGQSPSLVAPFGILRWIMDADREIRLWIRPEMSCPTYSSLIRSNPYLGREMLLEPERKPVNFGGSFWYNSSWIDIECSASFAHTSGTPVILADTAGHLKVAAADANVASAEAAGTIHPSDASSVRFTAAIRPSYFDGTTTLLTMNPLVALGARAEYSIGLPATVWCSADFTSRQNVDVTGENTLGDRVVIGAGASTSVLPRTLLSVEAGNLFNMGYEWWRGYEAPGVTLRVNARVNFQ